MKKLLFSSLLFVFFFLPVSSFGGSFPTLPPVNPGCCQYSGEIGSFCEEVALPRCPVPPFGSVLNGFFPGESCSEVTGQCSEISPEARNVPTLSEWGLIIMAGVMGLIGYMLLRRRKAAA